MSLRSRTRKLSLLAVLAAALVCASNANAGCVGGSSQAFKQFGDLNYYSLIANGGFESTTPAWAFSGGAAVVNGNETFYLNNRNDRRSASLPAGASATSPAFCIQADTPLSRFVARTGSGSGASLRVDLVCPLLLGGTAVVTAARFGGSSAWAPTPQIPMLACLVTGGTPLTSATIQVRIVAESGCWHLDDFYLDPYKKVR